MYTIVIWLIWMVMAVIATVFTFGIFLFFAPFFELLIHVGAAYDSYSNAQAINAYAESATHP
ncbi:MAG: hypothetical protein ABEJ86_01750 [Halococcoides sp.]